MSDIPSLAESAAKAKVLGKLIDRLEAATVPLAGINLRMVNEEVAEARRLIATEAGDSVNPALERFVAARLRGVAAALDHALSISNSRFIGGENIGGLRRALVPILGESAQDQA